MTKPRKPTRLELYVARDMLCIALKHRGQPIPAKSIIARVARETVYPKMRRKIQAEARRRQREIMKIEL